MDKFISIGVNQGDSFYLEREGKKILIDGGRSMLGFSSQFERTVGIKNVDVIVCTHADADHINGLIGYFESGLTSKELWLPGKWTSRLQDLLEHPEYFCVEILKQIENSKNCEGIDLENLCECEVIKDTYQDEQMYQDVNLEHIGQIIEKSSENDFFEKQIGISYCHNFVFREPVKQNLFLDAIDTAEKIRKLAVVAYHSGTKIRWFEFESSILNSGGEAYLVPVNSKEIFRVSKPMSALLYLSVSKSNKQSLVFYSPSFDNKTDVLFCGDSDLSFAQKIPTIGSTAIITSPHHGSEHNKNAYKRLKNYELLTDKTIFVRSDGKFAKRPGNTYKNIKSKKICTLCRHPEAEKQNVEFASSTSGWRKKNGLHWCYCI